MRKPQVPSPPPPRLPRPRKRRVAVETGDGRLRVFIPSRSRQPSRLQDRVVVLHRQREGRRRPALRLPGHVLPRRHRSHAGQSLAVGDSRSLHDAPCGQRRQRASAIASPKSCRAAGRDSPERRPIATTSGTTIGRRNLPGTGSREPGPAARAESPQQGRRHRSGPRRGQGGRHSRHQRHQPEGRAARQRLALLLADAHADDAARSRSTASAFAVTGESWMDHEFGTSFLEPEQRGWDWLSIQLSDNRELMLYQLRRADGSRDPRSSGTLVDADGKTTHLAERGFHADAWTIDVHVEERRGLSDRVDGVDSVAADRAAHHDAAERSGAVARAIDRHRVLGRHDRCRRASGHRASQAVRPSRDRAIWK